MSTPVAPPEPADEAECDFERVGRIVAVTGGHAIILLDAPEFTSPGQIKSPEIGTLLKVETPRSTALALVSALSAPAPSLEGTEQELRIVEVEFIGELPKGDGDRRQNFRRGISAYPSLGDVVGRASKSELARAYSCNLTKAIRIGHIHQDSSIPAMAKLDELLGKHFAVLGTTGTGKSCAVALILRRILESNPQAHILLLDVHREYAPCFHQWAEIVSPDNLNLPFWFLNFEEIVEILIGSQPNRDADIEILRELIPIAKLRYLANQRRDRAVRSRDLLDNQSIGIDTPVPYRASDLVGLLDEHIGKLDLKGELAPYKRLKARIETISRDPRYGFMFGSLTVQDTMAQALGRLFRIPVANRPITILELGGLPSEIINVVVSVLARMAFDFGVWSGGRVPITFVCEEAHRYVPIDRTLGFEPTKRAISRIAKEGRKYAIGLCVVSQRPAELDPSILSQCNTIFSLRLSNERDQEILKAGISDAAASLLEFMPTMGQGEAIAFGEGIPLPSRIKFDRLPKDAVPHTTTATFSEMWDKDLHYDGFLADVVTRWRLQTHFSNGDPARPASEDAAQAQSPQAHNPAARPLTAP
ncbi:MAG TPA: ATP-binding protein, partial [Aestuariivirgaceae bacterium]|nr:ATP-binding protein [Aestuariivirgaceae bacterium]